MTHERRRPKREKKEPPALPAVTEETIDEIIAKFRADKDAMFRQMAASNPALYQVLYGAFKLPETDKDRMFGLAVGMYHMLESELQKEALRKA